MSRQEIVIVLSAKNNASGPVKSLTFDLKALANMGGGAFSPLLGSIAQIGKIAASVAVGGVAALGLGLGAVAKASVDTAMEFEQQMANVAAIMEKPISEMAELEALAQAAAINPKFRVTLTQAAEAMEMLARNGVDAEQMMGGMLDATILLANSVDTDFKTAADIMTDAMSLFGDEGLTAVDVVNQITGVVNNSKFSIDDYFLALGRAGAGMVPIGASFQEFNATLANIAPIFNSGMRAGTSLVNAMNRLVPTTNKAKDAFLQLGWAVVDEETGAWINNFFKPAKDGGGLKDMAIVVDMIRDSLLGLPPAAQLEKIITIFGRDAQPAITALLELGDSWQEAYDSIGQTDAFEAAATRMATLDGAIEITGGYFEALRQTIGDVFLPVLTALMFGVQAVMENIINYVTPALMEWEAALKSVAEVMFGGDFNVGSFRDWAEGLGKVYLAFNDISEMDYMKLAQDIGHFSTMVENGAPLADIFSFALEKFASDKIKEAVGTVLDFKDKIFGLVETFQQWLQTDQGEAFKQFLDYLATKLIIIGGLTAAAAVIGAIVAGITAMVTPMGILATTISLLVAAYKNNWGGFADTVNQKKDELIANWNELKGWWEENGAALTFWLDSFGQSVVRAFNADIKPGFMKVASALAAFAKADYRQGFQDLAAAMAEFQSAADKIGDQGARSGSNILTLIFGEGWEESLGVWWDGVLEKVGTFISENMTIERLGYFMADYSPARIIADMIGWLFDTGALNEDTGKGVFTGLVGFIADGIKAALALIWEIGFPPVWLLNNVIIPFFTGFAQSWADYDFDWGVTMTQIIANLLLDFVEAITGLDFTTAASTLLLNYKQTLEAYQGQEWQQIATALIDLIIAAVIALPMTVYDKFGDMLIAMTAWFSAPERDWDGIGEAIGTGIFNFFSDVTNFFHMIDKAFANVFVSVSKWFKSPDRDWGENGEGLIKKVFEGISHWFKTGNTIPFNRAMQDVADAMDEWFKSPDRPWAEFGTYTVDEISKAISAAVEAVVQAAQELWAGFVRGWTGGQAANPLTVSQPYTPPGGGGGGGNNNPGGSGGGGKGGSSSSSSSSGSSSSGGGGNAGAGAGSGQGPGFGGAVQAPQFPTGAATGQPGPSRSASSAANKVEVMHQIEIDQSNAQVTNTIRKIAKEVVLEELAKNNRTVTTRRRTGI